jgi:hypothetical protein
VQPSSLIFLVLIGIWAAYLLQHWVRRREHLATARSVDRFSDAMRILERRSPMPAFDLSAPRPRSYALSPARPSRPEVVVKRTQTQRDPALPAQPLPATAVRSTRIFHLLAGVSARRARGLSLLASLSLAIAAPLLVALSVLPWWSVLVAAAVLVADVAVLRHAAISARSDLRAAERVRRASEGPARAAAGRSAESAARREPRSGRVARSESETWSDPEADPERAVAAERVGPAPEVAAAGIDGPVESAAFVDPSAWAPVPVPPPTYTLKAKAADPVPVSAPVPVVASELGASECWSLDGMVYDCDLDELVERRSATGA